MAISLLLEGPAYSVFSQLSNAEKGDIAVVKKTLVTSFGLDEFDAFERFTQARWSGGSIDVYVAFLRRLTRQANIESDEIIRKKLITSLPMDVSRQLRALVNSTSADLGTSIKLARTLMAQNSDEHQNITAVARERRKGPVLTSHTRRQVECWHCGEKGHISRYCPLREQGNEKREPCAPAVSQQMERRFQ